MAATVGRQLFDTRTFNNVIPDLPNTSTRGILKHQTFWFAV